MNGDPAEQPELDFVPLLCYANPVESKRIANSAGTVAELSASNSRSARFW